MQKSDPLGTVSSDVEVCFFQYSQLYQYLLLSRQPFWIFLDYRWSALLYVQRCLKFFNVPEWTQNIIAEMSNTSKIIFELSCMRVMPLFMVIATVFVYLQKIHSIEERRNYINNKLFHNDESQ